jgi:Na+-transporting NADH:ubiquinone oxidoreductase subunit NqrF
MERKRHVFISDRDKGIAPALFTIFPSATPAHCCQHIADNIQQRDGIKCHLLFWPIARAKSKELFKKAFAELEKENSLAAKYLDNIPHNLWA